VGDVRDLRALLALSGLDRQAGARHQVVVARGLDGADVEEGVTRAVAEFDEGGGFGGGGGGGFGRGGPARPSVAPSGPERDATVKWFNPPP
jgi:hypothetical protein